MYICIDFIPVIEYTMIVPLTCMLDDFHAKDAIKIDFYGGKYYGQRIYNPCMFWDKN